MASRAKTNCLVIPRLLPHPLALAWMVCFIRRCCSTDHAGKATHTGQVRWVFHAPWLDTGRFGAFPARRGPLSGEG